MAENKILSEVGVGEVFKVAGFDFIKFYDDNGNTAAVAKDMLFNSVFGDNNNFAKSGVLKKLKKEVLAKIVKEIGTENVMEHETDLLSLDGSDKWGKVKTKISLPTFDFYRKHVKIFDKHKVNDWWWLVTPDTTTDHCSHDSWVSCVSPRGYMDYYDSYGSDFGVRPFCIFKSSISVSC